MAARRGVSKFRLPSDVKMLDPAKLPLPHLKTMLEFMGVLIRNQPKPKGEKATALTIQWAVRWSCQLSQ